MTRRSLLLPALLLVVQADGLAQDARAFLERTAPVAGIYALGPDEHLIVTPHPEYGLLSAFWLESGEVRGLAVLDEGRFAFGQGLYPEEPYGGSIAFDESAGTLRLAVTGEPDRMAVRVPMIVEPVEIRRADEAVLAGLQVTPPGPGPFPAAVILPSGYNDRYQNWRLAMALLERGVASIVYDARGAGASTGRALPSHYYARSMIRAEDAAAVARWARSASRIDPGRTGVLGWSQGGWLGAIVAGSDPAIAFWVDIAGNLNPGWQQARHARLGDLRYQGYDEADVAAAARYFDAFYGVAWGEVAWDDYAAAFAAVRGTDWMRWLEGEGFSVTWDTPADAAAFAAREVGNLPERDLHAVGQPALGIYFGRDESSPPDSPVIFARGLTDGGNDDWSLRVVPDATHEAYVVDDWLRKADPPPTRLSPEPFLLVAAWIAERTAP